MHIFSYLLIFGILAALAYRDFKDYILPNVLNAALALSFCAFHILTNWVYVAPLQALLGALAGGGLLLGIRLAANRYYKTDALGLGDVKLATAAGLGLGLPDIFMALAIGSFLGVIHGLCLKSKRDISLARVHVPAGVGLCLGIAAVMLYRFGIPK